MNLVRAFFSKIMALLFEFLKRTGETYVWNSSNISWNLRNNIFTSNVLPTLSKKYQSHCMYFYKNSTENHLDNSNRFNANTVEKVQLQNYGRFQVREVERFNWRDLRYFMPTKWKICWVTLLQFIFKKWKSLPRAIYDI